MNETPPTIYAVRDWKAHYEVSDAKRTAEGKPLSWVAVKTKHDGKGFRRLMKLADGLAVFGAFILVVEIAAKMPRRGVMYDIDGPLTPEDMEAKTGAPAAGFGRALELLSDPEVGINWIEVLPSAPAEVSRDTPEYVEILSKSAPTRRDGTVRDVTRRDGAARAQASDDQPPQPPPTAAAANTVAAGVGCEGARVPGSADTDAAAVAALFDREGFPPNDPIRRHPNATPEQVRIAVANADDLARGPGVDDRRAYIVGAIRDQYRPRRAVKKAMRTREAAARNLRQADQDKRAEQAIRSEQAEAARIVREMSAEELRAHHLAIVDEQPEGLRRRLLERDPRETAYLQLQIFRRVKAGKNGHAQEVP